MKLTFYIQPGARVTQLSGWHDLAIKIKVRAQPVDNAANIELKLFLSKWLGCAKSKIEIVSGLTSRKKIVEVRGVSSDEEARIQKLINQLPK